MELGGKYRIFGEGEWRPQVAINPLVGVPTGDAESGLSLGHLQLFLPIWLQKGFGSWTIYGGGGYFLNPGAENRNYWFSGIVVERKTHDRLNLGFELYHQTSNQRGTLNSTGYNIGGSYSFNEHLRLLTNVGNGFETTATKNKFSYYAGLQVTFWRYMMPKVLRSRMLARSIIYLALASLIGLSASSAVQAQRTAFEIERTIPLKGVSGRIDHMAIDLGRKRLFAAELGNNTVDVINIAAGTVDRRIGGFKKPQGVGYAAAADVLAVANAGDGSVRLFRGADLRPVGMIDLGDDADDVRLDRRTGNFVVGYGSGGLAVIDPAKASLVKRVLLKGHPEGFQVDSDDRAFINVPDAHQIAVVDMNAGRQSGTWQLPNKLRSNFPMALDALHEAAAVAFRAPHRLVLFDTKTGKPTGTLSACSDADDVYFDAKRRRIYASCGDGSVDAWQRDGSGYRRLSRLKTASGARTSLFVPDFDRLYVAARAGLFRLGSGAAILVLRPVD